jgi:spermidine/putrescine transport system permease protein
MDKNNSIIEKRILSIPPVIYLIILFLIPILIVFLISIRQPSDYGGVAPLFDKVNGNLKLNLTLDSVKFVLHNVFIWQLCIRSLYYSFITTIICLFFGYPLALLIAKTKKKYRDMLLLLIIIPFWSCFLIRIYAWMILLGPESVISHTINFILIKFGHDPINILYSKFAVTICLVYINLPFMVLPLYTNLEKHDDSLIEASRDLGASRIVSFLKITLPLSIPGILSGSALVFIPSIGMFVVPELVGNNCSLMIGNLIKQQFLQTMNWPLGSVTSLIMTLIVLFIAIFVGYITKKKIGVHHGN